MFSRQNLMVFKDSLKSKWVKNQRIWNDVSLKWNRALTCPVILLPHSSLRTSPTRDDERRGSWAAYRTFAAQLRKFSRTPRSDEGWAVRRSVRGRRINGVSPPSPSPWVDPHGPPSFLMFLCDVFHKTHLFQVFLSFKMIWFSHETIQNIELLIIVKIENWPIKRCPEQGGANRYCFPNHFFQNEHASLNFKTERFWRKHNWVCWLVRILCVMGNVPFQPASSEQRVEVACQKAAHPQRSQVQC